MIKLWSLLFLAIAVAAGCSSNNYETAFGGYETVHRVDMVTFDVEPTSMDLVVAGKTHVTTGGEGGPIFSYD